MIMFTLIILLVIVCTVFIILCMEHIVGFQKGFHVHKWRNICETKDARFRNKPIVYYVPAFRLCSVCDTMEDDCHQELHQEKAKIIKADMYEKDGVWILK